jgi:diacylglycerol kinase family enzyme
MRAILVYNAKAGDRANGPDDVADKLRDCGFDLQLCSPKDPELSAILAKPADMVIAAGGDGTVGRVIANLSVMSRPLAVIPLGTANNIAQSLGIAADIDKFVETWRDAQMTELDIGAILGVPERKRFVEGVGFGALVQATRHGKNPAHSIAERMQFGRAAFCEALAEIEAENLTVSVDGAVQSGTFLLLEIMNISHGGSGIRLAPEADPRDGLLDVVAIPVERRAAAVAWFLEEHPDTPPPAIQWRGMRIQVTGGSALRVDDWSGARDPDTGLITATIEPAPIPVLLTR